MLKVNTGHISVPADIFLHLCPKFLILLVFFIFSQLVPALATITPRFGLLDTRHGLSNNNISTIFEDSQGYIWFGTREGGVNRFDGSGFESFSNLSGGDGLLHNYVTSIVEDNNGLIWMGTMGGGINYFNPRTREVGNVNSLMKIISYLPSKNIHCLHFDTKNHLWIGTPSGLIRYSIDQQSFVTYHHNPGSPLSLGSGKILSILEVGDFMLAGTEVGLDVIDLQKSLAFPVIEGIEVRSLMLDHKGALWVGTIDGLRVFDHPASMNRPLPSPKEILLKGQTISALAQDQKGNIWIATNNHGLSIIDAETRNISTFLPDPTSGYGISDRAVNSILIDRSSTVWLGTHSAGINIFNPFNKPFFTVSSYRKNIGNPGSLNLTFLDSKDRLWLATREGMHQYNHRTGEYLLFKNQENNNFTAITEFSDGSIVAGTFGSGLFYFNERSKVFQKKGFTLMRGLEDLKVWYIMEDTDGIIWVGTIGNGVYKINYNLNLIENFVHNEYDSLSLSNNYVKQIVKDREGALWFITNHQGVCRLKHGERVFKRYLSDDSTPGSLPNNSVDDIYSDKEGNLYFSTYSGLSRFDFKSGKFEKIDLTSDGGPVVIKGIVDGEDGYWWITKNDGIIRYEPQTGETWHIDDLGFHFGEFKRSAIHRLSTGQIIISATIETIIFNPDDIIKNTLQPRLALTNLYVNHEIVDDFESNSVLRVPLNLTERIVLNPWQRNFSIEFSCLNIFATGNVRFFYMLEGFDKQWIEAGKYRNATYTNLNQGQYVFKLRAVNMDGTWVEEPRTLHIEILPEWYKTWWFKIAFSLFIAISVLLAVTIRIRSLKNQRIALQKKVEEKTSELNQANQELKKQQTAILESQATIVRKKEQLETANHLLVERNSEIEEKNKILEEQKRKLEELSQTKDRFFANISHEFKTPLTLILGPLENLADRLKNDPDYLVYTDLINRNSRRLLALINQLLDISRIESGKMKLSLINDDIVQFAQSIYNSFTLRAQRLNISYKFITEQKQVNAWFDPDKVEKILFNLLSNAFKFTPVNGNIELSVSLVHDKEKGEQILFVVSDSGIGIPTDHLAKVFDYFTQIGQSNSGMQGSGIGLSLVKQMAEIHQGNVHITSEENKGTRVSVRLRIDSGMVENNELQVTSSNEKLRVAQPVDLADSGALSINYIETKGLYMLNEDAPYVLIIEDNPDILLYVKDILKDQYNVLTATEGCVGYDVAVNMIPDLVICDIMLPDCSGTDICKMIKGNEITNHIPIIVLTALGSEENIYQGLETGVDNYITKPFNPQLLKMRVNNLINTRKNLIEKHKINFLSNELQVMRSKTNEDFVQKLVAIIEENIEDPDFSNENIASQLNVSTRQLYRKLEGMLSIPLNKFIRHIKMKKAMEIMQTVPDLTISEIAYKVGFNDPKYFSKCFKEEFGSLPSELLKTTKPGGDE